MSKPTVVEGFAVWPETIWVAYDQQRYLFSQGASQEEAISSLKDAIRLYDEHMKAFKVEGDKP